MHIEILALYHYGYERSRAYTDIRFRWNVNDVGDIYFHPCSSIFEAMHIAEEYNSDLQKLTQFKGVKAAQKKAMSELISKHHSYVQIGKIVRSVFEVL